MREREICPSLSFQDHQLIIHLSKMQDIMHTNLDIAFIQSKNTSHDQNLILNKDTRN